MIDRTGGVDRALGIQLNRTYRINDAKPDTQPRRDALTISKFSALVERGRACAMALPEVRADRVSQARSSIEEGNAPDASTIGAAMINSAVEGLV